MGAHHPPTRAPHSLPTCARTRLTLILCYAQASTRRWRSAVRACKSTHTRSHAPIHSTPNTTLTLCLQFSQSTACRATASRAHRRSNCRNVLARTPTTLLTPPSLRVRRPNMLVLPPQMLLYMALAPESKLSTPPPPHHALSHPSHTPLTPPLHTLLLTRTPLHRSLQGGRPRGGGPLRGRRGRHGGARLPRLRRDDLGAL